MGGGHNGGSINPNDLAMSAGNYNSFQNNYNSNSNGGTNGFSSGSALFGDDELLDGLTNPADQQAGMQANGQDFGGMNDMSMSGFAPSVYATHGLPLDQQINGYSNTPDGDPIQSPFVHSFGQYRQIQHPQAFGSSLQSPGSYGASPLGNAEYNNDGTDPNFLKARARVAQAMQRKPSNNANPLTPKTTPMASLNMSSSESYGAQPIRTTNGSHHEKSHSGQWVGTPKSLSSFPGSGFSSPMQQTMHSAQINEMLRGGTSMPAKLGAQMSSTQEAKRKRRRESHNLVERRRRDNINERIQDLSKLVPIHRLEDEKIKKLITSGTPLSPTLSGISSPSQATSGLAGPGARRATSGATGNITTGLPVEDKDKGPNKGDILNGSVSWTRDLMWMLNLALQRQEELVNVIVNDYGGAVPFETTEDEKRMTSELFDAMARAEEDGDKNRFTYSRSAGTGLRVPHYTDIRGESLSGGNSNEAVPSLSLEGNGVASGEFVDNDQYLDYDDDGGQLDFKEEDEYMLDLQ